MMLFREMSIGVEASLSVDTLVMSLILRGILKAISF